MYILSYLLILLKSKVSIQETDTQRTYQKTKQKKTPEK